MAEVIAVIGTIGAVCNIVDVINKTIALIGNIRSKWNTADLALLSLASQLTALRAALTEIQKWLELNTEDMHHQLTMDLDVSLSCCRLLASELETFFTRLNTNDTSTMFPLSVSGKMKIVASGQSADDIQKLIEQQISSLTLLLTACNCTTLSEQKTLLKKPIIRKAIHQTKVDTASLLVHRDNSSFASKWTDNMSKLSLVFDFDTALLSSKVYERIFRSSLKRSIRQRPSAVQIEIKPTAEHYFLLLGSKRFETRATILQSLYRAVAEHPIDVGSMPDDPDMGTMLKLNSQTTSLTIIYLIDMTLDTRDSLKYFISLQKLQLSSKLPLVVLYSHGLGDHRDYLPVQLVTARGIKKTFQSASTVPFRYFDLFNVKEAALDRLTGGMVGDVVHPGGQTLETRVAAIE